MSHTNATESDVQDLLDTDLTTAEISPFLTAAQRFVTDNLESEGIANATLTEIEKYLAAFLVTSKDPTLVSASVGDASETYQRSSDAQDHLRVAAALDPTGQVKARFMDGSNTVSFRVSEGYDSDLDLPAS